MPLNTRTIQQVHGRLISQGRVPSHFVWLFAGTEFAEASNGVLFAYLRHGEVVIFALDPLFPEEAVRDDEHRRSLLEEAWREARAHFGSRVYVFIALYRQAAATLVGLGFTSVQMGEEPWTLTENALPTGNAGKGVRSARNRALEAGLVVEEWTERLRGGDGDALGELNGVFAAWRAKHFVEVTGFLNATRPLEGGAERRYFVACRGAGGKVEGFLVATPIPAQKAYFLEDTVLSATAPRGVGELLTVEALERLRQSGIRECSLGIVAMVSAAARVQGSMPPVIRFLFLQVPKQARRIYNFDGLELFRKRFKPHRWEPVIVCFKNESPLSETRAWFKVIIATVKSFRIRTHVTIKGVAQSFWRPMARSPVATLYALAHTLVFLLVNGGAGLPVDALNRWAFFAAAPVGQWVRRSFMSDFLYFDRGHFLGCGVPLLILMWWAEKSHGSVFVLLLAVITGVGDDLLNYFALVRPFESISGALFHELSGNKDVGSSLLLCLFLGLQLCQLRRIREVLLAALVAAAILFTAYDSPRLHDAVRNLNHALFLLLGFVIGKAHFEWGRYQQRRASKAKARI